MLRHLNGVPLVIFKRYSGSFLDINGPGLKQFMLQAHQNNKTSLSNDILPTKSPFIEDKHISGANRKVYFETYGCQMNQNDTDIAWSVLKGVGYTRTMEVTEADVILAVTCAVRENAERKIWQRLEYFKKLKRERSANLLPLKIGLLGCMAERLKVKLLKHENKIDLIAGPDSYRDLPRLLSITESGQPAVNVLLSIDETYADISPVRVNKLSTSAFVSIMRGCNNMCSFCVVPFTRGRERSRPIKSILAEIKSLSNQGIKEITLLGQNVNSYHDLSSISNSSTHLSRGFSSIYKRKDGGLRFAELLNEVANIDPEMRIRFTSPHPKDFPDELLYVIRDNHNVCKHIHLPVQSGSTRMLQLMRRGHSHESYLDLVNNIRSILPEVTLSSDFIAGFCDETEEDHLETLSLLETVQYDMAYIFAYSMRNKTHAYHKMTDSVPEDVKKRRLKELIDTFYSLSDKKKQKLIGTEQLVLVETVSKRNSNEFKGRTDGNIKVIFPSKLSSNQLLAPGDYTLAKITHANSLTLRGETLKMTTLQSH